MKKKYGNINLDFLSADQFLESLKLDLKAKNAKKKVTVNFINAHCFNIAQIDNEYLDILNSSTYVLNDGVGIKLGGKILGVPVVENLNGTDLIPKILKMCEIEGYKVFLLGAKQKNLTDALRRAANLYPDLNIDGHDGFLLMRIS
ncbi:N-acetylmannosaminyltransferase [Bacillus sp. JCM 19046]|nr:N-acetylmannosaminyltransferase [Bacillus sp. JCM 19046]